MEKIDLKKDLKKYYSPSPKNVELIEIPRFQFIMIDGKIEPGMGPGTSPGFQEAMGALYGAAYTLKYMLKQRPVDPIDYPVMGLEGLWWVEDGNFSIEVKDNYVYTVMILQPDFITDEMFREAIRNMKKKKGDKPDFDRLRLEAFQEGLCVQIMHIGPYSTEPATVEKMEEFARAKGYKMAGKHHEIYLGNPLLAQPEKLRTILRHSVSA